MTFNFGDHLMREGPEYQNYMQTLGHLEAVCHLSPLFSSEKFECSSKLCDAESSLNERQRFHPAIVLRYTRVSMQLSTFSSPPEKGSWISCATVEYRTEEF